MELPIYGKLNRKHQNQPNSHLPTFGVEAHEIIPLCGMCPMPTPTSQFLLNFVALWIALSSKASALEGTTIAFTGPLWPTSRNARGWASRSLFSRPRLQRRCRHGLSRKYNRIRLGNGLSINAATTSMSLLRTFDPSEIQLQRFIGELGFLEITDWYVPHVGIINRTVVYMYIYSIEMF